MKSLFLQMIFLHLSIAFVALNGAALASESSADENGGDLPFEATSVQPLLIGADAPDVTLRMASGESAALRDMYPGKPVMIVFYRGGWCPFCSRHLAELAAMEDAIHDLGVEIIAISPDSPGQLSESLDGFKPEYTLLSDSDRSAARQFGIAFQVTDPERVSALVERTGHTTTREGNYIFPVPAVFILDSEKVIRFQYVDPDYTRRISGAILMAAAEHVSGL